MPIQFFSKLGCEGSYFFFNCQIINRLLLIKSLSERYNYNPKTTPKPKMTPPGAITFNAFLLSSDNVMLSF